MKASNRNAVTGGLTGTLRQTGFAALLVQLLDAKKAGTLRIQGEQGELLAQVLFEAGLPVGARVGGARGGLAQALVPLCARTEGDYAFLEGCDQVGTGPGAVTGRVDPLAVIAAAMRGPFREDAIDEVLLDCGSRLLKLNHAAQLARYGFTANELRIIELLRRPMDFSTWRASTDAPTRTVRCLAYALILTRGVTVLPAARRSISGTEARAVPPPIPASLRPQRIEEEPTHPRVVGLPVSAPPAALLTVSDQSGVVERVRAQGGALQGAAARGRYHVQEPAQGRTELPSSVLEMPIAGDIPKALELWRKEILLRHQLMAGQNHFDVLGVGSEPDDDELLQAYITLSNRFQPEDLPEELRALKRRAAAICDRLSEAYEALRDPSTRAQHQSVVAGTSSPRAQARRKERQETRSVMNRIFGSRPPPKPGE